MVLLEILIIVGVVLVDIATKVAAALFMRDEISIIDGVFSFYYVENTGASFGMLKGQRWLFVTLTLITLVAFGFWLIRAKGAHRLARISVCLIAGGAIGNMFDRIVYGYVRDFIYFKLINFPVFNIADSALTVGVILLAIYVLFIYKEPVKEKATSSEIASADGEESAQDDGTEV